MSASDPATPPDRVLGYQLYSEGSEPKIGPLDESLSPSVSNYIADGAGVNIPSESLGFYFSGMAAGDGSQPSFPPPTAMVAVESFIQVQMSSAPGATWSNLSWPSGVVPRANAQLVWLPVSSQGVLIVIGGVVDPSELANGSSDNASQTAASQLISPTFMTSLPVYDIGSQQWFVQNTSGKSPSDWQLTEFCSVVAKETGSSTFEIFIYGGYNGLNGSSQGDIWVLSIPSFTWIQVYPGTNSEHFRSSHACVKPYPDQMFVIGGESVGGTPNGPCFNQIIDVFNLSSLMWLDSYDPTVYSNYTIPSVVANGISATATAVAMNSTLSTILGSKYGKPITTYYPYVPLGTALATSHRTSGPTWLPAVLGAVLGVVGLSVVLFVIWWFCYKKSRGSVTSGTQSNGRVHSWFAKTDASITTTEVEDSGNSPLASSPLAERYEVVGDLAYRHASPPQAGVIEVEAGATRRSATSPPSVRVEADGTARYEMHALEQGSPDVPAEMATSYYFRDHPLYPRNPAGASQTMSPSLGARSTTSRDDSTPSAFFLPERSVLANDAMAQSAVDSAPLSSPDQSPPQSASIEHRRSYKRNVSSTSAEAPILSSQSTSPDLDALERISGLGYSNSRPIHTRNMSSLSSGIAQLPSPAEPVPVEEERRRSALLSGLPPPPPATAPMQEDAITSAAPPLVSNHLSLQRISESRSSKTVVTRKQVPARRSLTEDDMRATAPWTL